MSLQAVILPAVAPVYAQPTFSSEMITQGLMWENVRIMATDENWYQISMKDGYNGWIHSFYLYHCKPASNDYIYVTSRAVPLF